MHCARASSVRVPVGEGHQEGAEAETHAVASHGSPPCTSVRNMCMNFGLVLISAGFKTTKFMITLHAIFTRPKYIFTTAHLGVCTRGSIGGSSSASPVLIA